MATTVKKLKLESDQLDEHSSHCLNWDLCMLCQKQTNVKLQCPNNSKRDDAGAGYMTFVTNFNTSTAKAVITCALSLYCVLLMPRISFCFRVFSSL